MDRRLQWFGYLEKMEESAWSSKCRTFKVSLAQENMEWGNQKWPERKENL